MFSRLRRHNGPVASLDIEACYRLLLGREPDPEGLAHYQRRVAVGEISMDDVVSELLASLEFSRSRLGRPGDPLPSTVVDTGSFRIHVLATDHAIGHAIARSGSYEPQVADALRSLLRPGGVFLDVGANYGWHSLVAASVVGADGRVIAIEPNPLNAELLRRSAADSGFANVEVVVAAAADTGGLGALETDGSNGRIIVLDGAPSEPVPCSFVVPLRRLDEILEATGSPAVDVMKIDVEGNEAAALQGASELIGRDRPAIISEFFPQALVGTGHVTPEGYLGQLRALGYRLSVVGGPADASDAEIVAAVGSSDHLDLVALPA